MKKLLNKKGSVLFLVVVVMSILLVVASATYYIVSNQRQSVEVHYNSEQSYQTAYSVSKTVHKYLSQTYTKYANKELAYEDTIFKKMNDLGEDETITAANDLQEFGLGKYDIEIKRKKVSGSDDSVKYFEITTKAVVNGESTSIVEVCGITLSAHETKYFTRFLTSTGNRNGDVQLTANKLYGDTYFENPFTILPNPCNVQQSVYSAGNLLDTGLQFTMVDDPKSIEVVIENNYYVDGRAGGTTRYGELYVGGNFVNGVTGTNYHVTSDYEGGKQFIINAAYVYNDFVNQGFNCGGDYFVRGDCYIKVGQGTEKATYYIEGDLYLGNDLDFLPVGDMNAISIDQGNATFYVKGNVHYVGKNVNSGGTCVYYGGEEIGTPLSSNLAVKKADVASVIDKALVDHGFSTWDDVKLYIDTKTAKGTYNDWLADEYFEEKYSGNHTIKLDDVEDPAVESLVGWDSYMVTINESCTIQQGSWSWGRHYIVVDTDAAGPDGLYIRLDPNGSNLFNFGQGESGDANNVFVLVKGQNPLVLIIPDDVNFKMPSNSFFGHLDVFLKRTGMKSIEDIKNSPIDTHSESTTFGVSGSSDFLKSLLKEEKVLAEDGTVQKDEFGDEKTILIFDKSKFSEIPNATPHNNIFLVTNGNKNTLDFNAQSTFCGYIYAPNVSMPIKNGMKGVMFFGGLIVGTYSYTGWDAEFIFTDPYDDTYGTEIVTHLMGICNGGKDASPSNPGGEKTDVKIYWVGYE